MVNDPLRPTEAELDIEDETTCPDFPQCPAGCLACAALGLRAAYALALPRLAALLVGACQRYEYDLPHEDGMHAVLSKAIDGPYIRADHLLAAAARLVKEER